MRCKTSFQIRLDDVLNIGKVAALLTVTVNGRRLAVDQLLDELPEADKEFLLACFAEERGAECVLARKMGVSRDTVRWRKEKLVKMLKEKFL